MNRTKKSLIQVFTIFFLSFFCILASPAIARIPQMRPDHQSSMQNASQNAEALMQSGRSQFDARHFTEAAILLQQAVQAYQSEHDPMGAAIALGNLTLTYQQLGQWQDAEQTVSQSLKLLASVNSGHNQQSVLAQILEAQGSLQFAQGQSEQAAATWEQSVLLYQQIGDTDGIVRSRISQSQALQTLGRYRRAIVLLTDLAPTLQRSPNDFNQVQRLRSLGDALRVAGSLEQSVQMLQQSLAMAQKLGATEAIAASYISLGNTARVQENISEALNYYQKAIRPTVAIALQVQSQLNQLSLLLDHQRWSEAESLVSGIQTQLETLPQEQWVDAQINFAYSLFRLKQAASLPDISWVDIAQRLTQARVVAAKRGDRRTESYALGLLGSLYEHTRQWNIAKDLTDQALQKAQALNATDIIYRWQWQQGRLLKAQNQETEAIGAYDAAVDTLRSLRRDVVVSNLNFQLSFRQQTEEPLYRELIELLLKAEKPAQQNLQQARQVITSLQVLQLENFLQEPCADATPEALEKILDQATPTAAIFYPIILENSLEIIYKLPQDDQLHHYRSSVSASELKQTIKQLQLDLEEEYTFEAVQSGAQKLYRWMTQPARKRLEEKGIDTLVFALDSVLRNVPMAVLHDGEQYLIENYAIALAPDLSLPNPQSLQADQLKVLAVGLTDPPKTVKDVPVNFAQLKNVNQELDAIAASGIPTTALRDQAFTSERFNTAINRQSFPVVHLATHGQFSSDPQNAFLLTSNGEIGINDLDSLFRVRGQLRPDNVELLILSACETAIGDELATLGIAGAAFRAGARSAIASLWTLDDAFGVEFTREFYKHLGQPNMTKAKALQMAQKALLANPQYEHPRYWATYVLIGNWL